MEFPGLFAFLVVVDVGDVAVAHVDDAVGHAGDVCVVGDDGGGGAELAVDAIDGFEDKDARFGIEGAGGFVAEQDGGTFGDGAGDGDPLLLAAGELGREVVAAVGEADEVKGFFGLHGVAGDFGNGGDVFQSSEAGDEVVELKYEADMEASVLGELGIAGGGEVEVTVEDVAAGGAVETAEDVEQGGFAAAGGAEQDHHFPGEEFDVDAAEGVNLDLTHVIDFCDAVGVKNGLHFFHANACARLEVPMAIISPARRAAFEVLKRVHGGAHSDTMLYEQTRGMGPRDAGLAHEIVYGVLRHQNQLDWQAQHFSGRAILTVDEPTAILLRMGIYQMRYLSRIPAHAAVMEAVELAKRSSKKAAAGLVNAVLRKVHKKALKYPDEATELAMPEWLLERWKRQYGAETARGIALVFLRAPEKGMDPGARTIVPHLGLESGQRYLDLCAAPGNKTWQALKTEGLRAVACDRSFKRLLGLEKIGIPLVHLDAARELPFRCVFDRVLADVPCSGTGTLGRNPEIKWRIGPEEFARQQGRQIEILRQALAVLKPGGRLVYSTCSLEKEENEEVIAAVCGNAPVEVHRRIPGRDPGDGFFAAVVNKSE